MKVAHTTGLGQVSPVALAESVTSPKTSLVEEGSLALGRCYVSIALALRIRKDHGEVPAMEPAEGSDPGCVDLWSAGFAALRH